MAALICWASGLLEVVQDKDVPVDTGPVVLGVGTAGRLRSEMTAHGVFIEKYKGWYVPGTQEVPTEGREEGAIQNDRMTIVITFNEKLKFMRTKNKKGLRAALAEKETQDAGA